MNSDCIKTDACQVDLINRALARAMLRRLVLDSLLLDSLLLLVSRLVLDSLLLELLQDAGSDCLHWTRIIKVYKKHCNLSQTLAPRICCYRYRGHRRCSLYITDHSDVRSPAGAMDF